jgi:hypothetical protein
MGFRSIIHRGRVFGQPDPRRYGSVIGALRAFGDMGVYPEKFFPRDVIVQQVFYLHFRQMRIHFL